MPTTSRAVTLVHEFQHSKLSAVLDIVPLYDNGSGRTFFAPWARDRASAARLWTLSERLVGEQFPLG